MTRLAACRERRFCVSASSTAPCWSTVRQSQRFLPLIVTRGRPDTNEQEAKMFYSRPMTIELILGIAQTEQGKGHYTGFAACTKQNDDVA